MKIDIDTYIRPAIALAFTGAFIYGFLAGMIGGEAFLGTATMVVTWWFKSRDEVRTEPK